MILSRIFAIWLLGVWPPTKRRPPTKPFNFYFAPGLPPVKSGPDCHSLVCLGLEYIHMLTQHDRQHLRIELTDWNDKTRFVEYEHFYISDRDEKFKLLSIGSFTGNAGQHQVKKEPYTFLSFVSTAIVAITRDLFRGVFEQRMTALQWLKLARIWNALPEDIVSICRHYQHSGVDLKPFSSSSHIDLVMRLYTVNHKKRDILFLTITLANLNRFL